MQLAPVRRTMIMKEMAKPRDPEAEPVAVGAEPAGGEDDALPSIGRQVPSSRTNSRGAWFS